MQVSALDQELIEVDPDTKEMLKLLVSWGSRGLLRFSAADRCLIRITLLDNRGKQSQFEGKWFLELKSGTVASLADRFGLILWMWCSCFSVLTVHR